MRYTNSHDHCLSLYPIHVSAAPSPVVLKIVSNLVTATVLTAEKVDDIILTIK